MRPVIVMVSMFVAMVMPVVITVFVVVVVPMVVGIVMAIAAGNGPDQQHRRHQRYRHDYCSRHT